MQRQDIIDNISTIISQSRFHEVKMLNITITCSSQYLEINFISDIRNQPFAGHLRIELDLEFVISQGHRMA